MRNELFRAQGEGRERMNNAEIRCLQHGNRLILKKRGFLYGIQVGIEFLESALLFDDEDLSISAL